MWMGPSVVGTMNSMRVPDRVGVVGWMLTSCAALAVIETGCI